MSTRISCSDNFSGSSFPLPLNSSSTLKKSFGFSLSSLAPSFMRSFKNDEVIPIVIPVSRPIFLLNPCKSSNLRQGKMSDIFGRPDSSMILVMALKNSEVTSASGSAKSRDNTTFPSMLNDARKAKRATSTLPPRASFSIHISMSSTLFLLIAAVSFIFRLVNISELQTRRSTRQNAPSVAASTVWITMVFMVPILSQTTGPYTCFRPAIVLCSSGPRSSMLPRTGRPRGPGGSL
nr:hypothetical protein D5086_0000057280 [Ipomoea batatas]GME09984.1 hypothetical protein D5086_0000057280 [Ipomoea batatas]GME09985.1 hypothetical protein D5086_0000057280 [Ipomoea batatas]